MSNKNFDINAKGAVLILVLFAAALGITGLLLNRNAEPVQEVSLQEPMVEQVTMGTQSTQPTTAATLPPSLPAMNPEIDTAVKRREALLPTEAEPEKKALQTASPVPGDTIGAYAMDCLSYNETTRDWRTHNGIDLAAEEGTPVCAAADGTVYTTYEDDTLGNTVVIRHEGGYTTRYSSLREDIAVKPGDAVTLGQTIGYAGDSALVETVMGTHVHFSVSCMDTPMDPEEFFALS